MGRCWLQEYFLQASCYPARLVRMKPTAYFPLRSLNIALRSLVVVLLALTTTIHFTDRTGQKPGSKHRRATASTWP